VNGIEREQSFSSWYLRRTPKGYEVLLLGKTGEPLKGRAVSIYFKHKYMSNESCQTLQSNAAGLVFLGPLPEIEYLYCSDNQSRRWYLANDSHNLPTSINAQEGTPIQVRSLLLLCLSLYSLIRQVAFMNTFDEGKLRPIDVGLFELRKGTIVTDHFDKLSYDKALLTIKGLAAGNYELYMKQVRSKVPPPLLPIPSHTFQTTRLKR